MPKSKKRTFITITGQQELLLNPPQKIIDNFPLTRYGIRQFFLSFTFLIVLFTLFLLSTYIASWDKYALTEIYKLSPINPQTNPRTINPLADCYTGITAPCVKIQPIFDETFIINDIVN